MNRRESFSIPRLPSTATAAAGFKRMPSVSSRGAAPVTRGGRPVRRAFAVAAGRIAKQAQAQKRPAVASSAAARGIGMRTSWPFTKKNAARVSSLHAVTPRQCEKLQFHVAELMYVLKYRKMVEKEIDRVEEVIRKLDAKIAPMDAQARAFYNRLVGYFPDKFTNSFPAFKNGVGKNITPKTLTSKGFATNKVPSINGEKLMQGQESFYGTAAGFGKMTRSLVATVIGLLDVYKAREPLDAQHGTLSMELGMLYENLSAVDKKMAGMAKVLAGCVPRQLDKPGNSPFQEENLR